MIAPRPARPVRLAAVGAIVLLFGFGVALLLGTDGTRSPAAEEASPSGQGAGDPGPVPDATAAGTTSALALAPAPAPAPGTASGEPGARVLRLRGRTVRAGRMPASGVSITLDVEGELLVAGKSGPDGGFVLQVPVAPESAPTSAWLLADDGIGRQAFRVLYLGAGESERNLGLLVLEPTTTLDVRVSVPSGTPAGVRVEALQVLVEGKVGQRTEPSWAPRAAGITDGDGSVTLSGLGTGRYQVVAGARGFGRGSANVTLPREGDAVHVALTTERIVTVTVVEQGTGAPIPGAVLARLHEAKPFGESGTTLVPRRPALRLDATDAAGRTVLRGLSEEEALVLFSVVAPGYVWAGSVFDGEHVPRGVTDVRVEMARQASLRWPIDGAGESPPEDGTAVRIEREPCVLPRFDYLAPRARVEGKHLVVDGLSQGHLPAIAFLDDGRFAGLRAYDKAAEGPPLRFRRPLPIHVRLRDVDGAAVAGWILVPTDRIGGAEIGGVSRPVETDASGLAELGVSEPGTVRVRGHPVGYPHSSRDLGDVEVGPEGATLEAAIPVELGVDVWVRLGSTPTLPEGLELFVDYDELRIEREDLFAGRVEGRWSKTVGAREATVHVRAPGWLPAAMKVPIPDDTRRISAVFDLAPAARIRAVATSATGFEPRLALQRWDRRDRDWAAVGSAPWMQGGADPDVKGSSLHLDGLVPGRYRLVDLESGAASAPAEAEAGVETRLSLDLSRAGPVRGRVVAEGDADVSQARVHVEGGPAGDFAGLRPGAVQGDPVGKDGTFTVMVPGTEPVRLTVSHPNLEPATDGGSVTVNGPRDGVVLRLEGAPVLVLPLVVPAGGVIPASQVHQLDAGEPPKAVRARPEGEGLVVEGLSPGVHTLLLDVPPWAPVVVRNVLVLPGRTTAQPVTLSAGGRVRVHVRRAEGAVAQDVDVVVTGLEAPGYRRTARGSASDIVVTGLAKGRVRVTSGIPGGAGARLEEFLESDGSGELEVTFEVP